MHPIKKTVLEAARLAWDLAPRRAGRRDIIVVAQNTLTASYLAQLRALFAEDRRLRFFYTLNPKIAPREQAVCREKLWSCTEVSMRWAKARKWDLVCMADHGNDEFCTPSRFPVIRIPHGIGSKTVDGEDYMYGPGIYAATGGLRYTRIFESSERRRTEFCRLKPELEPVIAVVGDMRVDQLMAISPTPSALNGSRPNILIAGSWSPGNLFESMGRELVVEASKLFDQYDFSLRPHPHMLQQEAFAAWRGFFAEQERHGFSISPPQVEMGEAIARAAAVVCDDLSSVALYAALLHKPLILARSGSPQVPKGSALDRLGGIAPNLHRGSELPALLRKVLEHKSPAGLDEFALEVNSRPGQSTALIREEIYSLLNLNQSFLRNHIPQTMNSIQASNGTSAASDQIAVIQHPIRLSGLEQGANRLAAQIVDALGQAPQSAPFIIAVGGVAGSGKSTFSQLLKQEILRRNPGLNDSDIYILEMDHFLIPKSERTTDNLLDYFERERFFEVVRLLKAGNGAEIPQLDNLTRERIRNPDGTPLLHKIPANRRIIIADGILVLSHPQAAAMYELTVFINSTPLENVRRELHRKWTQGRYARMSDWEMTRFVFWKEKHENERHLYALKRAARIHLDNLSSRGLERSGISTMPSTRDAIAASFSEYLELMNGLLSFKWETVGELKAADFSARVASELLQILVYTASDELREELYALFRNHYLGEESRMVVDRIPAGRELEAIDLHTKAQGVTRIRDTNNGVNQRRVHNGVDIRKSLV
jgi:uridine kinase